MKQGIYTITANEALTKDVWRMVLAGDTSAMTAPGQFVEIALPGFYLRRPISVCDYDEASITIIYKVVGQGTDAMTKLVPGDTLDLLTGLGNGFDPAKAGESPVLVGGGVGVPPLYSLAKKLIEAVETRAKEQGKKAVIAVCNPEGNPVAVHVMDGAFLVSYEVAVKKAYTAVAVKMSTMELSSLCQPGGTFYGLQSLDKVITFGGGIPLYRDGVIVGGLGVSGGTGEEDHDLALYGAAVFQTL